MASAPINVSTAGANTIVGGQTGRRVRVQGFTLVPAGTVTMTWQDGAANNLSGPLSGLAGQALTAPVTPPVVGSQQSWLLTTTGQSLVLNLSAAVAVGGTLVYDFL
jgi:hypothetical protein